LKIAHTTQIDCQIATNPLQQMKIGIMKSQIKESLTRSCNRLGLANEKIKHELTTQRLTQNNPTSKKKSEVDKMADQILNK
jgi:hypothetical protein